MNLHLPLPGEGENHHCTPPNLCCSDQLNNFSSDAADVSMDFDDLDTIGRIVGNHIFGIPNNGPQLVTDHAKSKKSLYLDGRPKYYLSFLSFPS